MPTSLVPPAIFVRESANAKLGQRISATYLSQSSCPQTCPFLDNGCYAELGNTGIHTKRLNQSPATSPVALATAEAQAIRRGIAGPELPPDQALRLHVVGDATTPAAVRVLTGALAHWLHGPIWTYTHAWRSVARRFWQNISTLASCEDLSGAVAAMKRGYAAAMVVVAHRGPKAYTIQTRTYGTVRVIPCPNQTLGKTCRECKLCWRDTWLHQTSTIIAFAAHGTQKSKILNVLKG